MAPIASKIFTTEAVLPSAAVNGTLVSVLLANPLVLWTILAIGAFVIAGLFYLAFTLFRRSGKQVKDDVEAQSPLSAKFSSLMKFTQATNKVRALPLIGSSCCC